MNGLFFLFGLFFLVNVAEDLGDRLVEIFRDGLAFLDLKQRPGERDIPNDGDVFLARDLKHAFCKFTLTLEKHFGSGHRFAIIFDSHGDMDGIGNDRIIITLNENIR